MTDSSLMMRVAALKVLSEFTKQQYDEARAEAEQQLTPGDRRMVRSPLHGEKIGAVAMTDPKPVCEVTNEPALRAWLAAHYPEQVETGYEVTATQRELVDVLFQHAPHLLHSKSRIKPEALRDLRAAAVSLGQPVGPGGEADVPGLTVRTPPGVVRCTPDEGALLAVMELHGAGLLGIDGQPVERPQIEGETA